MVEGKLSSQLKRIMVPLLFLICAASLTASDAPQRSGPTSWTGPAVSPFIREITRNSAAPLRFINSPATINTDRDDYSPGQTANILGSGWHPGEAVRLQVVHIDAAKEALSPHSGHDPWYVTADGEGWVRAQWYVGEESAGQTLLLTADGMSSGFHAQKIFFDAASITLEQCHNYTGGFVDCVKISSNTNYWGSGNAQSNNARLTEGDNQNFRAIMEEVPPGTYTLDIELDLTKGSKVAYDRYSSPGRLPTATDTAGNTKAGPGVSPESVGVFPCSDSNNNPSRWCTPGSGQEYLIPNYPATLIPTPAADPLFRADVMNSQAADPGHMFLYGAGAGGSMTMLQSGYSFSGSTTGDSSVRFSFTITKTSGVEVPMVLAWGAHISKTEDYVTSGHTTATTINGSPYHMRLKAFSALQGSPGNQDMQMAASAIVQPTGSVTIIKVADPLDSQNFGFTTTGTGLASFTLDDDGLPGGDEACSVENNCLNTQEFFGLAAGSYSVQEAVVPGWELTNIECSAGGSGNIGDRTASITITGIENVTCTFTNTRTPRLKLVKTVTNDNGGTAVANDWDLVATGTGGFTETTPAAADATFRDVEIGVNYALSESGGPSGYTQGSFVCDGGTQVGDNIQLAAGDQVTCTVNNNDQPANLIIIKNVINDNGGNAVAGDFSGTITGAATFSGGNTWVGTVSPGQTKLAIGLGSYNVLENAFPGYAVSYSADCSGSIALGDTKTCTVTNNDIAPTLTLIKSVINNNGGTAGPNDFGISVAGNVVVSGATNSYSANTPLAINEAGLAGYAFVSITGHAKCPAALGGTVTLDEGESVTCTITNDDQPANLIIIKNVINNNGGTAVAGDFGGNITGTATFGGGNSWVGTVTPGQNKAMTAAGTYNVVENVFPGYSVSYSADCSGSIALGQTKTCTVTNDDQPANLIIIKNVINNNGGTAVAGDFGGNITGTATFGGGNTWVGTVAPGQNKAMTAAGTYNVVENVFPGYSVSYSADCVGSIALGQTKTCTVTNDDQPANLIIIKSVINDNGGTAVAGNFSGTIGGTATFSGGNTWVGTVTPGQNKLATGLGTYSVAENAFPGYAVSYSADCTGSIALGETKTCTVTNNDISPTLTVIKYLDPTDDPGLFNLRIDAVVYANDVGHNGTTGAVAVNAGSHTVSETAGTNTDLDDYVGVIGGQCAADGSVSLALAENKVCTITNTRKGSVQVIKTFHNAPITGTETFSFTLREGASATDEGDILETQVANSVNGGTLNFSYGLIPGQNYQMCELVLVGWTSSLSSLPGAFVIQTEPDGDNSTVCVEFSVEPGETAIFNINNMPPPGGGARTIGYWRNWSRCTNGRQSPVLDYILWSFGQLQPPVVSSPLPYPWDDSANYPDEPYVPGVTLGLLQIDTCEVAVKVLRKQVVTATRRGNGGAAGNPAINMAAQLFAAILNVQAGAAPPCDPDLIDDALQALIDVGYNGTAVNVGKQEGSYLNALAAKLDAYNNNELVCPLYQKQ